MVIAERGLTPVSAISDRMPGGIAMSVMLHAAIAAVIVIGLPTLFRPAPLEDMPIAVELVNVAPETRATHPNPYEPRPEAKPDVTPAPPAPKPEPKPEPPKPPAFEPPPASAAPPPPPPTPVPQPPAPTPAPTPPAPPPLPKPAETHEPPPPPPIPKPPEPKPTPPKPVTETPPKPAPDKKADTAAFDTLLKNLSKQDTARAVDAPPQRPQRVASAQSSSQPKAPLGSQLTTSELDLIKRQIAECWNVPAGARDAQDLVIELRVDVNADGTVNRVRIVDTGRYSSDDFFRAAADSAVRAVRNPRCSPLRLPADKYDQWKNLDLFFNPKDVL